MARFIENTLDVTGKHIIPLYPLLEALSSNAVIIDKKNFENSFFAPALTTVFDGLVGSTEFQTKRDAEGKVDWSSMPSLLDFAGVTIELDGESFNLITPQLAPGITLQVNDVVYTKYIIRNKPNWHRTTVDYLKTRSVDGGLFHPLNSDVEDVILRKTSGCYIGDHELNSTELGDVGNILRHNRKTLASFVRQYGIEIDLAKGLSNANLVKRLVDRKSGFLSFK